VGPQTLRNFSERFFFTAMNTIKNIIFDLGGVLLDIDTNKTNLAFEQLGIKDFKNNYTLNKADALFDHLETGAITETAFYNGIRNISQLPLRDEDIRDAWNALLLNFRIESLQYLEQLAGKYKLYLLSNTNSIHHTAFHNSFKLETGKNNFDDYFTKAYYSQQIGLRKPEKEIYHFVLQDAGIAAGETLFIDDLLKNIEAAASVGINTHHLQAHERIEHLQL
jgi:putative hydrolase of the HAD superfamily